jgi:hypothetical protein
LCLGAQGVWFFASVVEKYTLKKLPKRKTL